MTTAIDAHHHYWELAKQKQAWRTDDHAAIARDYEPRDLTPQLVGAGVDATVLVQSVDSADENDRLAHYANEPTVAGVVGWLPLGDAAAARAELARANTGSWRGVRCLVGRSDLSWLTRPGTVSLFRELADRGIAWDIVPVTSAQIYAVLELARAVPHLRIVVDHLARPPIDTGGWEPWASQLAELARCPNVTLKVSVGIDVLTAWDEWQPEHLAPYVRWAVECFGTDRLMLASNWPVVLLRAEYGVVMRDLAHAVAENGLSASEMAALRGGTAQHVYGLTERSEVLS